MEKLNQFLLLKPFLKMISEGTFFAKIFAWFLRILAVLAVIAFCASSYGLWAMLGMGFEVKLIIFIILTQIFFIALLYVALNILLVRSSDIEDLPSAADYKVIPIFVIVMKMIGELLAAFHSIMGIAAGLAIWILGTMPGIIPGMRFFRGTGGFVGGLSAIILGPVLGFLLLSLFYMIAEQIGVFVDIARNTKR